MRHLPAAAVLLVALTGCNSFYQNTYQKIWVETPSVEEARCILETPYARYLVLTPGEIMVDRSPHDLKVTCEKTHYISAETVLEPKLYTNPMMMNVSNGIVPGVAYDIASRSIWTYPEEVSVEMVYAPPPPEETVEGEDAGTLKKKETAAVDSPVEEVLHRVLRK